VEEGIDTAGLPEEDRARADCYALISRLFYAPTDVDLLRRLAGAQAPEEPSGLQIVGLEPKRDSSPYGAALRELEAACRETDAEAIQQEYDALFIGAGKALITPYTSGYAVAQAPDRYLLALREHLVAWGLVRRDSMFEIEDHVSAVCDVMRWLIERERPLEEQHAFFDDFVYTGVGTFCNAIEARATTPFYRAVAELARTFLKVEREAFELHDGNKTLE
jgi:TorA maturation chaperone TorD